MVKLKIGTVSKKKPEKEEIQSKVDDYFNDLSDEDLEVMQVEADEITEEIEETVEDDTIDEEEAKEALDEISILDKVGINAKYANKFTELYPKKRVIYRNLITKQFLEWYIKNVKIQLLSSFKYVNSEHINQEQCEKIDKLLTKRLNEDIEIDENVEDEIHKIEVESKEDSQMYELLLHEKWKEDDRAKGITELDTLIEEQMRINKYGISQALYNLINIFKLDKKLKNIGKKEPKLMEKLTPVIDLNKKIIRDFTTSRDIQKSIKYFHHIEFLYNLMGKMDFAEPPTEKDIEHITQIKSLVEDRIESEPNKKTSKTGFADYIDFVEGK